MLGVEVFGRLRGRGEGVGVQACGGDQLPPDAAELGELEGLGHVGGPFLAPEDRGQAVLQGDQSLAPPELGDDVGAQLVIPGQPVEAAAGRGLGVAESPERQEGLAERRVRPEEPRIEPEGLLVVADRLVQPVGVPRAEAEVVSGEAELRIELEGPMVVDQPLRRPRAEDDVVGLGVRGVDLHGPPAAVHGLVQPALAGQGDAEHVLGQGERGVDPQGLSVVDERLVQPGLVGPDLAEVVVGRRQPGVEPDGLAEVVDRLIPLALTFQGQAEVVVGRGEVAVDRQGLLVAS